MANNLKVLLKLEECEYVWNYDKAKELLDIYTNKNGVSKTKTYEVLAEKCFVSEGAIKNWFTRKNGPGDIDQVKALADVFGVDYILFLKPLKSPLEEMMEEFMEEYEEEREEMFMSSGIGLDYKTIMFVEMLNRLARATKEGFIKFSELSEMDEGNRIVYVDNEGENQDRIIMDMCVDRYHHDAISYVEDYIEGVKYVAKVMDNDDESKYIYVDCGPNRGFIVEDGYWYSC